MRPEFVEDCAHRQNEIYPCCLNTFVVALSPRMAAKAQAAIQTIEAYSR